MLHFQAEVGILRFGASEKKGRMPLLRKVWRRENGTGAEATRVRIAFVPKEPSVPICGDDVLRRKLHGVKSTPNCSGHVLLVPHGGPNVLVIRDRLEAIRQHLLRKLRERC